MITLSPLSFFNEVSIQPREQVYVVSDSMYADYQKREAQKQIDILQSRADEYSKALTTIQSTIDGLKQEHGLIEPATQQEE